MTDQQTPAGWYPHPQMAGTLRYWDGEQWTEQVAPMPQPPGAQKSGPGAMTIARGVALGIAIVLAGLFFLGRIQADNNRSECLTENVDRAAAGLPALDCD